MDMLQNAIILTTGFLLSQVLIASNTHFRLIAFLLRHSGSGVRALLTSILLISYSLTIFLSNTVVVLALIPVIRRLMDFLTDTSSKKKIATLFYLALTFGTTTGGLASLSGHPLNALALGIAELYKLDGRSGVNFFSWLMVGLPASMLLVAFARMVLMHTARDCSDTALVYPGSGETAVLPHRPLLFFAVNMIFITTMTGIQFFFEPEPVAYGLSPVDLVFLFYGLFFLFFTFLYPRKKGAVGCIRKNMLFLLFFLATFPLLSACRLSKEIETHLHLPLSRFYEFLENRLQRKFNNVWQRFFRELPGNLETPNFNAVLSINRIILDIPYFGLLLILIFGSALYVVMQAGDNPAIPGNNGYLITALTSLVLEFIKPLDTPLLLLPALNLTAAFSSEVLSNTAIVVILAPLMITMASHTGISALLLLLSLTVAASAAYMTPLASPANTLAFGGMDHVSLKTVIKAGMIMNMISAMLISALFMCISVFL